MVLQPPYLALLPEDDNQRRFPPREVFMVRSLARTFGHWRVPPDDPPP